MKLLPTVVLSSYDVISQNRGNVPDLSFEPVSSCLQCKILTIKVVVEYRMLDVAAAEHATTTRVKSDPSCPLTGWPSETFA